MTNDSLTKTDPRVQLDFGGIGQGYGADVIADFMRARNITDMLIEIGGEGMAIGTNLRNGKRWEIGILDPQSTLENQFFKAYIALENQSFTTSGNYFNYHIVDGKRYSHTMDPASGYPAQREILSASVFAIDATTADVWGTAFMAMGHEKAIELLKQHPELDAILMYSGNEGEIETYVTPAITAFV
jgi:thiamine biosynthesis lipoprotein